MLRTRLVIIKNLTENASIFSKQTNFPSSTISYVNLISFNNETQLLVNVLFVSKIVNMPSKTTYLIKP